MHITSPACIWSCRVGVQVGIVMSCWVIPFSDNRSISVVTNSCISIIWSGFLSVALGGVGGGEEGGSGWGW